MGSAPHPASYWRGIGILSKGKSSRGVMLIDHLHPVPSLRMCLHNVGTDTLTFIMGFSRQLFLALSRLGCLITHNTVFFHGWTALVGLDLLMFEVPSSFSDTTFGRTPLDEWSDRRKDLYLTTHNTRNRQTSIPPVGFEPAIPTSDRPQTYALDHTTTGIGPYWLVLLKLVDPLQLSLKSDYHTRKRLT